MVRTMIKVLSLVVLFCAVSSKIVPTIDENYEDCLKGGSVQVIDMSNLKFIRQKDNYFINGNNQSLSFFILKTDIYIFR